MAERRVAKRAPKQELDEGDRIEFGATVEVKNRRNASFWPKATVTTTIRPGETVQQAKARASGVVHQWLEEQVEEFLG